VGREKEENTNPTLCSDFGKGPFHGRVRGGGRKKGKEEENERDSHLHHQWKKGKRNAPRGTGGKRRGHQSVLGGKREATFNPIRASQGEEKRERGTDETQRQ